MFRYNFVPLHAQNGSLDIALADPFELDAYALNDKARQVIERGMALLSEEM